MCRIVEEQLVLIGQEAVNNAVRHGQASRVAVEIDYRDDRTFLRVADDGVGFDPRPRGPPVTMVSSVCVNAPSRYADGSPSPRDLGAAPKSKPLSRHDKGTRRMLSTDTVDHPTLQRTNRIRVLCVDDHRVMLDGLALLIGRQPDMEVIASATSGEQAVELYARHLPDITLMDLQLPTMSGLEAISEIRASHPDARIVVLTMYQGDEDIYRALEAGATAYLLKDTLAEDLVNVIREVHTGNRPIPADVAAALAVRKVQPSLTPREIEVVHLITQGLRNKEIAVTLGISEETAKVHVKNILAKLHVSDRAAVIAVAVRRGIIHIR